jgi:hypothetical protein
VVSSVGSPGGQAEHVSGWLVGSTLWCPLSATWMHWYVFFFFAVPGDFHFHQPILSLVRKRHRGWSNSSGIGALDRGFLRKKARDSCVVKTTTKKRRADGKRTYSGNRWLKGTQPGPHHECSSAEAHVACKRLFFSPTQKCTGHIQWPSDLKFNACCPSSWPNAVGLPLCPLSDMFQHLQCFSRWTSGQILGPKRN